MSDELIHQKKDLVSILWLKTEWLRYFQAKLVGALRRRRAAQRHGSIVNSERALATLRTLRVLPKFQNQTTILVIS